MGAAAFLMIEFLALPYSTIVIAAIAPAFMHFFGVFWQVHFEAKRTGLRGLSADELPSVKESFRKRWPTLIPLVLLVGTPMSGFTPYASAFAGITSCIIVGLTTSEQGNNAKGLAVMLVLHAVLAIIISGQFENYGVVLFAVAAVVFVALLKTVNLPARFTRAELIDAFSTGASTRWQWRSGRHRRTGHRRGDAHRRWLQGELHRECGSGVDGGIFHLRSCPPGSPASRR